jgi:cyclic pyranopterin phosphate synthase
MITRPACNLADGPLGLKRTETTKASCLSGQPLLGFGDMTKPTHLDETGTAHMVDVGAKPATQRRAVAGGRITMSADALEAIRSGNAPKGDVLSTARIAGIMAAKRTADLIPLCHPLALTKVGVDFAWEDNGIAVTAVAQTNGPTGVEMEALTAASVALLTLYDMAKALDRAMILGDIRLLEKSGGRSGDWRAE